MVFVPLVVTSLTSTSIRNCTFKIWSGAENGTLYPPSPLLPGPALSVRFVCLFAGALFLARVVL